MLLCLDICVNIIMTLLKKSVHTVNVAKHSKIHNLDITHQQKYIGYYYSSTHFVLFDHHYYLLLIISICFTYFLWLMLINATYIIPVLLCTRWLPGFARVPYYAPSPCHMHPCHNCHHINHVIHLTNNTQSL